MSNSLWWTQDIAGVLTGLASSSQYIAAERSPIEMQIFQAGFVAALSSVAISFGINPKPIADHHQVCQGTASVMEGNSNEH